MDTLNQIVAKNILSLREKAGLSQLALALNADITPGALFEIEDVYKRQVNILP